MYLYLSIINTPTIMSTAPKPDFLLTKTIATIGPASVQTEILQQLIAQGVRIFRINFSHGTFDDHTIALKNIRAAEKESGEHIAVLGDLAGPKIRVGLVIDNGVYLEENDEIQFVTNQVLAGSKHHEHTFSTTFPKFLEEVKIGERILMDDGNIELECLGCQGDNGNLQLKCRVVVGGKITSAKGINLPDTELSVPSMTKKDFECVSFAVENGFDYLALSFVRDGEDVRMLKNELIRLNARPQEHIVTKDDLGFSEESEGLRNYMPIISKIEKPQAIDNLASIINETDAIMVARGDLGVEMDIAEVTVLQKKIIHMCHERGRPVIVATQMLESMIHAPVPTRAEVSDVANAIFDGADAVMLSGETAVGKYPVEAVKMMKRVAVKTNAFIQLNKLQSRTRFPQTDKEHLAVLADGVRTIVEGIQPKFIVIWTNWGGHAVHLSQQRTTIPLLAFNANKKRLRLLSLLYSITPVYLEEPQTGNEFVTQVDKIILENSWAEVGDPVVIVASYPIQKQSASQRIIVHYLGQPMKE